MLPAFRKALKPLLVKTCTAIAVVNTPDGKGGYAQSWPGSGTAFACGCQATGGTSAGDLSWSNDADPYAVLTDSSITIKTGSHIIVDGMTLEVIANTPPPAIDALRRYDCVRTTGGG